MGGHGTRGTTGDEYFDDAGQRRIAIGFLSGQPALQFFDAAGNRRILIDGIAVLQTFSDGTFDRVQMGNLPANGVSPAHWGFRINDANGNPIADTQGLIQHTTALGTSNQSGTQNFSATSYAVITGTAMSVTLARQADLMCYWIYSGKITAGSGNGQIRLNPGAAGTPSGGGYMGNPTGFLTLMAYQYLAAVPAGTYTMQLEAQVDAGATTVQLLGSNLTVFRLGG